MTHCPLLEYGFCSSLHLTRGSCGVSGWGLSTVGGKYLGRLDRAVEGNALSSSEAAAEMNCKHANTVTDMFRIENICCIKMEI